MPLPPYILQGIIYQNQGVITALHTIDTGLPGASVDIGNGTIKEIGIIVTATNGTTDEELTAVTNSTGAYLIDCGNYTSGYTNGDIITLKVEFVTQSETEDVVDHDMPTREWHNIAKAKKRILYDKDGYQIDDDNPLPIIETLRGNLQTTPITVTTTAQRIPTTALIGRKTMIIYNNSTSTVYVGGSNVTATNGLPVLKQQSVSIDASDDIIFYIMVATSTANVRVMEIG